jgi:hypothetical protein
VIGSQEARVDLGILHERDAEPVQVLLPDRECSRVFLVCPPRDACLDQVHRGLLA